MEKNVQYSQIASIHLYHTGISDPAIAMLKTALISTTCLYVMTSVLIFIVGFVCGHCFSLRQRKSGKESASTPTTEHAEDLELKENVAYITVRPK